jgi:hypothetical protein
LRYKLDITLVTVTSVLFRMLKISATDFGSDICHGVVVSSVHRKSNGAAYLELGAYRRVFIRHEEEEPRLVMKLSHTE